MRTGIQQAAALAALIMAFASPAIAQQRTTSVDIAYRACQTQSDEEFRRAIQDITKRSLQAGLSKLDYEAVVRTEWRKRDLDAVIDGRVDLAAAEIRNESSWASLLKSLAYRERAQELATAVAERVYRSDAVKEAMSGLATGVGEQIGRSIELSTIDASGPAQRCVKAFLGPRYGTTVANAVEEDAGRAFAVNPESGGAQIGTRSVVLESAGGLTGAVVLLVRRQLGRMAQRLGQRMVGVVLGRIVSVAAGGVGLALIAKDIWDLRYGMLPIISSEMKSADTKEKVRAELARSIRAQIDAHMDDIAAQTSEQIVDIWKSFKSAHTKVLELAESDAKFRDFVDTVGEGKLQRLDEVVALILPRDGANGVGQALRDGRLHTAVTQLDDRALAIARERGDLDSGLRWSAVAGDQLDDVVDLGLHRQTDPTTFTQRSLSRLLALENRAAKLKLAGLPADDRIILFELNPIQLGSLGRALGTEELKTLANYLRGLQPGPSKSILEAVAENPAKMQIFAADYVRDAVLASKDQTAAVGLLLRDGGMLSPTVIGEDFDAALNGRISPVLLWEKHPIIIVGAGFLSLLLLLLVRGLFAGSRRKQKQMKPKPGEASTPEQTA